MLMLRFAKPTLIISALGLSVLGLLHTAHALPSDRQQTVTLDADRATFNDKTGVTTYSGNVVITQGSIRIDADDLVVNLDAKRSIKDATANGRPAHFQQQLDSKRGLAKGEGQKVYYNAQTGVVTLSGNALLVQDGATFKGETVRYSMNQGDIEAKGGNNRRVQLVIPPSAQQTIGGARSK